MKRTFSPSYMHAIQNTTNKIHTGLYKQKGHKPLQEDILDSLTANFSVVPHKKKYKCKSTVKPNLSNLCFVKQMMI